MTHPISFSLDLSATGTEPPTRAARSAVELGDLRRVTPIERNFGPGRGKPVDRYYIECFLERHAGDVHGHVLEVGGGEYTHRYGGAGVMRGDVLHADDSNPRATIVADLADAPQLPDDTFDCFVCTQTLTYIYDLRAAVRTMHRILKPGGVALVTVPGIAPACPYDRDRWGEYWRFTTHSLARLLGEAFGTPHVWVEGHGNVLAATALLHGLAVEDLLQGELGHCDPAYQLIVAGRAAKA